MEKSKKITVVLFSVFAALVLCLGITFGTTSGRAYAAETTETPTETPTEPATTNVAKIGTTEYADLATALSKANKGDTITLIDNVELTSILTISQSVTLDLNGKKITENGGYILINGAKINVSVINGSIIYESAGSLNPFYPIYINAAATATIGNVTIDSNPTGQNKYGIYINKSCTGTTKIVGCDITSKTGGIINYSSGTVEITGAVETNGTEETVKECKIVASQAINIYGSGATFIDHCAVTANYGVYITPSSVNLTKIVNSVFTGYCGVFDKSIGELKIDNCTFDCSGYYGVYMNKAAPLDGENTADVSVLNSTIKSAQNSALVYMNCTGKLTVDNCNISAYWYGITGNGTYPGSDVTVKNTTIDAYAGIYSPEDGDLVVDGCTITVVTRTDASGKIEGGSGIEIRAGKLTVKNNTKITVPKEVAYTCVHAPSGGATTGAAIAIAQHTTNKAIDVNIESAILSADKSLAQGDPEDIASRQPVTMHVSGGEFTGEVTTERVEHFIGGGEFDKQPDPKYLVDHTIAYEEPNHKYLVVTDDNMAIINEASEYVMFYAAAWNIKYTDEISSIIYGNTDTSVAGIQKARQQAIAKVNEIRDLFVQKKKDAIAEIKAAAAEQPGTETAEAQAAVVVPTATIAAINAAVDEDQVDAFKLNALDEIKDIRNYRKQIKELGTDGKSILDAIAAFRNSLLGDGTTAGKLAASEQAIKDYLETNINDFTSTELDTLKGELDTSIGNAVTELKGAMAAEIAKVEKKVSGIAEAFGIVFDESSTGPYASTELQALKTALAELKTDSAALKEDSTAIIGKLDAMDIAALDTKLDTVKTDISALISDTKELLNGKLDTLTTNVGNLSGKLDDVNSGLLAKLEALGGKVDALGTVTTDALADKLTEIGTDVTELKSAMAAEIAKVEKKVDGITEAFGIVIDESSTDPSVSTKLEALKTALDELKADSAALKADSAALKGDSATIIDKLDAMDIAALNTKLDTVKADISALVSDTKELLNGKLETLTANVGTLTGRLNEVNSGLLTELEALGGQVEDLGTVTTDALAEKLTEIKTAIDSISLKVSSATGVEEAKLKAIALIKETLDHLFGENSEAVNGSSQQGDAHPDSLITPEQRVGLHKVYSDDMAVVVERHYNEALTAVENGTSVAEVQAAATNFQRDVEIATLIDGIGDEEDASLYSVYIMLIIALVFAAGAIVFALVSLFKKK